MSIVMPYFTQRASPPSASRSRSPAAPSTTIVSRSTRVFKKISDGSCLEAGLQPILDPTICHEAAAALYLEDSTVSFTSALAVPEGCYYKGDKLFFGINPANTGSGSTHSETAASSHTTSTTFENRPPSLGKISILREPLCLSDTGHVSKVSDTCAGHGLFAINAVEQCKAAAQHLGLVNRFIKKALAGDGIPAGCYIKDGTDLWMGRDLEPRNPICKIRSDFFVSIAKGTCEDLGLSSIFREESCQAAATSLGMKDRSVSLTSNVGVPRGCYAHVSAGGTTLWLGVQATGGGGGAPPRRNASINPELTREPICISKNQTTSSFFKIASGLSCEAKGFDTITQVRICQRAAHSLHLADEMATPTSKKGVPYGCYYLKGLELWLGTRSTPHESKSNVVESKEARDANTVQHKAAFPRMLSQQQNAPLCKTSDGASYRKIVQRTCYEYDLVPVLRSDDCWAAADQLGVEARNGLSFTTDPSLPLGCFLRNGEEIWMKVEQSSSDVSDDQALDGEQGERSVDAKTNTGSGKLESATREQICIEEAPSAPEDSGIVQRSRAERSLT